MGIAVTVRLLENTSFWRKKLFLSWFFAEGPIKSRKISSNLCRRLSSNHMPDGDQSVKPSTEFILKEDAGKSIHLAGETDTLIDFKSCAVHSFDWDRHRAWYAKPGRRYAFFGGNQKLVNTLKYAMQTWKEGSLRCDATVSCNAQEQQNSVK